MSVDYEIEFPEYLDGYEMETEAKGYLVDLIVRSDSRQWRIVVYDSVRLEQEIEDELRSAAYFATANLLVLSKITKDAIVAAVAELAESDFADFQ